MFRGELDSAPSAWAWWRGGIALWLWVPIGYAWAVCLVWHLVSLYIGYLVEGDGWSSVQLCVNRFLVLFSAFGI